MRSDTVEGDVDGDEWRIVFSTVKVVGGEGLIFVRGGGNDGCGYGCFFGRCGYIGEGSG